MPTISIIGAGNVGITLGLLFRRQGYQVLDICNRSLASAQAAVATIGAGRAVSGLGDMAAADILLITTSDNALQTIATEISLTNIVKPGSIVFHCSGATPSAVLAGLRDKGAAIASVHPIKSFTAPVADADNFSGTWCGVEGDETAVAKLTEIFTKFGANVFPIKPEAKVLYHAAIVFACNYMFPLIEAGLVCYEQAGVPRAIAEKILSPLLHATVDNALRLGPGKAITGPIARGDDYVVANQLKALAAFDPGLKTLYEVMGGFATRLALEKGVATPEAIEKIRGLLSYKDHLGEAA